MMRLILEIYNFLKIINQKRVCIKCNYKSVYFFLHFFSAVFSVSASLRLLDVFCKLHVFQLLVKKYTMERLAEIYIKSCLECSNRESDDEYDWIPAKILRCFYDKDFRQVTLSCVQTYI